MRRQSRFDNTAYTVNYVEDDQGRMILASEYYSEVSPYWQGRAANELNALWDAMDHNDAAWEAFSETVDPAATSKQRFEAAHKKLISIRYPNLAFFRGLRSDEPTSPAGCEA